MGKTERIFSKSRGARHARPVRTYIHDIFLAVLAEKKHFSLGIVSVLLLQQAVVDERGRLLTYRQ